MNFNMKLLLLSDPNSSHTIKWACSLAEIGISIKIFGLGKLKVPVYKEIENISVVTLNQNIDSREKTFSKIKYLGALQIVKKLIHDYKPDIIHAHYASSYGLLGALCGFQPYIISVWGTDVFSFPKKSIIHKTIIKYNLSKAFRIFSTSSVMADETRLYTYKNIEVIPFGVNLEIFKPMEVNSIFKKNDIVIGTIKSLEKAYGIEYLIRAFKMIHDKFPDLPLKLLIVGGGSLEYELKLLTKSLNIEHLTVFTGLIPHHDVPKYHNMLTISVSVSESESFGVAILEASACGKPVIVSNVGGLTEVVEDGVTGFIVPSMNPEKTAEAIEVLIFNKSLSNRMGNAGRYRVNKYYNWNDNVSQMILKYKEILTCTYKK